MADREESESAIAMNLTGNESLRSLNCPISNF